MALDGLMGMLAVVSTAVFFPHIISFSTPKLAVLIFGAGVAWPIAVAISRGYERTKIGVGGDEMRAVFRAVVLAIAAGAVPSAVTERPGVVASVRDGHTDRRCWQPARPLRRPQAPAPPAARRARTSAG